MSDETNTNEKQGWISRLSQQPLPVRGMVFMGFVFLIMCAIFGGTGLLYFFNVRNFPRLEPFAVAETVTVSELATFPVEDENVFPAAVAVSPEGTGYTGSYTTGALWRIAPDGTLIEISGSREALGSVVGLDVAADGTLYVLDRRDPFRPQGTIIWRVDDAGLTEVVRLDNETLRQPNDIVVDDAGRLYVADLAEARILQVDDDGTRVWWQARDPEIAPAGLAIDAPNNRLLVTDARRHAVYAIALNPDLQADEREGGREVLYSHGSSDALPGFNGITVAADGAIYIAALLQNEIVQIVPETESMTVIAEQFRGGSDVAYDATNNRLLVNNWDQSWLVPITFLVISFDVPPRVPFSVDAIALD